MTRRFTAALLQTQSGRAPAGNAIIIADMVRGARDAGADLIMTPETSNMMEPDRDVARAAARLEADDEFLDAARGWARDTGAWILLGSIVVKSETPARADGKPMLANRSILLNADGETVARFDKIHMFDVELGEGEVYRESEAYAPGTDMVLADTPWGKLGMTVCYDLRFAHLYRKLAKAGADFLSIPSAFTQPTGRDHWEILLRARAIETGCFVFAPAQTGNHEGGRKTYGHSLAVDPWGRVLADGGEEIGIVTAEIDPDAVVVARRKMPSLSRDREFFV
ncbi:MAG: carbon-nitrogen hydrolase family protein [Rhodospirillaceae bacterium]|nr:carbon-nitrogen hydrolase family protein [Rhodospirillaceae bacterium]MBT6609411.1 carbon-nitrogen hydrolase family protein [Rhodospirillaceae bacterium]MBT6883994.1 carbon-nitrogen hydrolase family protein [Rhodospirillaceae bacterium]